MVLQTRLDVDVPECEIVAWTIFGAVEPDHSVLLRRSGDVLKVDIVPATTSARIFRYSGLGDVLKLGVCNVGSTFDIWEVGQGGIDRNGVDDIFHVDISEGDISSISMSASTTVGRDTMAFSDTSVHFSSVLIGEPLTRSMIYHRYLGIPNTGSRGTA